ncbi:aldo/keto reductase [Agromyces sp. G08B096]|uniref:Aldo/keto reductase n=1 Tax=Agromyces sp. G08B096 TaxID=3156399 RepID=A0AAU7W3W9_9MICO
MTRAAASAGAAAVAERLGPLAFGGAPIGNLYRPVSDEEAWAALEAAWEGGIRSFDTAPHYGLGLSERRLGRFLRTKPRDEYIVSTKVGRLLEPNPEFTGGDDLADGFAVPDELVRRYDPSEAGVRRSLEESLERLGLDRVDVLYLHDPDVYDLDRGIAEGLPALARLRDEGLVSAVGIGTNDQDAAARAVREGDVDVVMLAGRYTLLEQPAAVDLLPLCERREVAVVAAAPYNSGLLATDEPDPEATYNYGRVPSDVLEHARALAAACRAEGVPLPVAAIRYPLRHPAVRAVAVGTARAEAVRENLARLDQELPSGFWERLADQGLIP